MALLDQDGIVYYLMSERHVSGVTEVLKEAYKKEPVLNMQGANQNEEALRLIADRYLDLYREHTVDNELSVVAVDETNGQDRVVGFALCIDFAKVTTELPNLIK